MLKGVTCADVWMATRERAVQISMSVRKALTVVVIMQPVTILTVATIAPAYLDSLEMDRCAVTLTSVAVIVITTVQ
jgi:hypothetical protein